MSEDLEFGRSAASPSLTSPSRRHRVCDAFEGSFGYAEFGERIKALRERRGMSLSDVAKASGLTKPHIWELERGRQQNPTVRSIWALANALSVPPAELLGIAPSPWTGILLRTEFVAGAVGAHLIVEADRSDGSSVEILRDYADIRESSIYHWATLRVATEDGSQTSLASDGEVSKAPQALQTTEHKEDRPPSSGGAT